MQVNKLLRSIPKIKPINRNLSVFKNAYNIKFKLRFGISMAFFGFPTFCYMMYPHNYLNQFPYKKEFNPSLDFVTGQQGVQMNHVRNTSKYI